MSDQNEHAFRLGKRAIRLIKEGNFQLDAWEEIYEKIDNDELMYLLSSIRNALAYGAEHKVMRGIVKSGFIYAMDNWSNNRKETNKDILVIGDRAIKVANDFIKKSGIRSE